MNSLNQIAIWNRALGFLGTRSVASERENTPEAIQCRLYWDSARRQVLRDFPWPFAQRRCRPARLPLPDGYEADYRFAYALPEDCLKAHEIRHEGRHARPFALAHHPENNCPMLLTDAARALLLYSCDVRDCSLFDDLFAHMLARKLAALVAVSLLKNNTTKINELEQLYGASLPQARQASGSEAREAPLRDGWLDAR